MTEEDEQQREPDLPWFKWYPRDWAVDGVVQLLDWQAQGIYRHLLDRQWIEGSIPADLNDLAAMVKIDPIFFPKVWEKIAAKFEPAWDDPARLMNPKLNEQRMKAIEGILAKIEGGRRGGKKSKKPKRRRRTIAKTPDKDGSSLPQAEPEVTPKPTPKHIVTDSDSDSDITTPPPPDSAPARARPDSWLTPFDKEWAKTHGGTPFLKKGARTGGELGRWLKIVKREIGEQGIVIEKDLMNEMFLRWRSFLAEAGVFATPAKFAKEHGLHKGGKFVDGRNVRRAVPREPTGREKTKLTPTISRGETDG